MESHILYWSEKAKEGTAIVFGPVMDPKGVYGIGVYQVQDEAEKLDMLDHDPANGLLKYEVLPMARAVVGDLLVEHVHSRPISGENDNGQSIQ